MLTELSIRNLAVVEAVAIAFHKGFHVLTGETGAGKSIIIDALGLVAGGRGASDLVRYGCDKAEIEAQFDVPAGHPVWTVFERFGIEASADETIVIRREISASGKSTSRVNGQLVNLTMLREAGDCLVNIHGQHEHQSLLRPEEHLDWLDLYDTERIGPLKREYAEAYDQYTELRKEWKQLEETGKKSLQMADLYRFQIDEISSANLKLGEDASLAEEKRKLANAEKCYSSAADGYDALYGSNKGGLATVGKAMHRIEEIVNIDPAVLKPILEQIQSAYYQLEDAAFQLRDYRDNVEFNPARLDEIETRLDLLASFRRKYGDSVADILAYLKTIRAEMDALDNKEEKLVQIQAAMQKQHERLLRLGGQLSEARSAAAERLAREIEQELKQLHMERTRFQVALERLDAGKLTREGLDKVEFMIAANPGEPLRPLAKIASGGELSRIMLAMKAIFSRLDRIPVLVFDEVDTGVSGRAAQAIAEKMSLLSRHCQVFSITHLPQVACMADAHFLIHKTIEGERTYTRVTDLQEAERVRELARMLGGVEITETTLSHAREMIKLADEKKMSASRS
ncbi:DNA repair protein RecN [Paenibacillus koleovorans]|uniref:DNA repair protein RecN n=1 Tax=Paenibacillus koleovorans TaxID=121608 RepID=UPI000FDBB4B5|nr:DNA repair protein RecN [Paenibacillus koleovorans]